MKCDNLIGKQFGRLCVIGKERSDKNGHSVWKCRCECGSEVSILGTNLKRGLTKSCGCYRLETIQNRVDNGSNGSVVRTHSKSNTRLYNIWCGMKKRCENSNSKCYTRYGGRGITVCDEWHDFSKFYEWSISNGYSDNLTIDRIDNNKGYTPNNCRWATYKDQNNNRRNNSLITYNGETYTLVELAECYGLPQSTLWARINRLGWDVERAVTTAINHT